MNFPFFPRIFCLRLGTEPWIRYFLAIELAVYRSAEKLCPLLFLNDYMNNIALSLEGLVNCVFTSYVAYDKRDPVCCEFGACLVEPRIWVLVSSNLTYINSI